MACLEHVSNMVSTGCLIKRPVSVNVFMFLPCCMVGGAVSAETLVCRPRLESGLFDLLLSFCGPQPVLHSLTNAFLHTAAAAHWACFPFQKHPLSWVQSAGNQSDPCKSLLRPAVARPWCQPLGSPCSTSLRSLFHSHSDAHFELQEDVFPAVRCRNAVAAVGLAD